MKTIKFGSITIVGLTATLSFLKVVGITSWSWWLCLSPVITALALAVLIFIGLQLLLSICDKLDKSDDYDYHK